MLKDEVIYIYNTKQLGATETDVLNQLGLVIQVQAPQIQ